MWNTQKLSPEALACVEQVQHAPESQKQWVFERACLTIKNKTQVATLALMLWLSAPVMVSTSSEAQAQGLKQTQNLPTRQDFVQNIVGYHDLTEEEKQTILWLYDRWLLEVRKAHGNATKYERGFFILLDRIASNADAGYLNQQEWVDKIVRGNILSEDSQVLQDIRSWQAKNEQRTKDIIAKNEQEIAKHEKLADWLNQLTETLKKLEK